MIPAAIKQKLILAAISAVKQTADARKHFKYWPTYLKLDPAWGLKLTYDLLDEIAELLPAHRNLRILYDERVEQNAEAYNKANQGKQTKPIPKPPTPAKPTKHTPSKTPAQHTKPDIDVDDMEDDADDFLDNFGDLLSHDDDQDLVVPKQNSQPTAPSHNPTPTPTPPPPPTPQNINNHTNDHYISNKASLYPIGSTVYWPSKRWGKLAIVSGKVIGKKHGTVNDFLVIETEDGRPVDIDPEVTHVSKKKPTWVQRLSTAIMGESIDKFLKS